MYFISRLWHFLKFNSSRRRTLSWLTLSTASISVSLEISTWNSLVSKSLWNSAWNNDMLFEAAVGSFSTVRKDKSYHSLIQRKIYSRLETRVCIYTLLYFDANRVFECMEVIVSLARETCPSRTMIRLTFPMQTGSDRPIFCTVIAYRTYAFLSLLIWICWAVVLGVDDKDIKQQLRNSKGGGALWRPLTWRLIWIRPTGFSHADTSQGGFIE